MYLGVRLRATYSQSGEEGHEKKAKPSDLASTQGLECNINPDASSEQQYRASLSRPSWPCAGVPGPRQYHLVVSGS